MADVNTHPIEGQILLLAGAQASVALPRVPSLVSQVQRHIDSRIETYNRTCERIDGPRAASYYLVAPGHWEQLGDEVGLNRREIDAVRRSHTEQFRRDGRRLDRSDEFEATLEIREVVAVNSDNSDSP